MVEDHATRADPSPRPPPPSWAKIQPAVVLIHGFGASVYHWRYNIPALVEAGYRVLALDLLGFGLSDKPIIEYSAEVWRDQVCFCRQLKLWFSLCCGVFVFSLFE